MKFEKLKKFKGKKHAMTAGCLLVGMFVLTSAVYANYDDARGYTNYKEAVKDLTFSAENFTSEGRAEIIMDGEVLSYMEVTGKLDGNNMSSYATAGTGDGKLLSEAYSYSKGKKQYTYYPASGGYYEYSTEGIGRPDLSDPTVSKAVRFVELFADTMVGDLKNNFVLVSNEDGLRNYSINVSGSQIPEIVNAGISLMFTASNSSREEYEPSYVTYEDYMSAFKAYYLEKTGTEMNSEAYYGEWSEEMENISADFYEQYDLILEDKGNVGIVYVKADGSHEYYDTYDEYADAVDSGSFESYAIMSKLGSEPYIENASCNFTVDKEGRLVSTIMEATMTGEDENGGKHSITLKCNADVFDYGNTTVDTFDKEGKQKLN